MELRDTFATSKNDTTVPALCGVVLVVDDSEDNQCLLAYLLRRAGVTYIGARSGEEALLRVKDTPPQLILMDLQMPGMDGQTATRILRERGITVPIIALTATAWTEIGGQRVLDCFTDYLAKPFDSRKLFSLLTRFLPPSGSSAHDAPSAPGAAETTGMTDVRRRFIERIPARVGALEEALKIEDFANIRLLSHSLAGADMFGLPVLGEAARSLENEALKSHKEGCLAELRRVRAASVDLYDWSFRELLRD